MAVDSSCQHADTPPLILSVTKTHLHHCTDKLSSAEPGIGITICDVLPHFGI